VDCECGREKVGQVFCVCGPVSLSVYLYHQLFNFLPFTSLVLSHYPSISIISCLTSYLLRLWSFIFQFLFSWRADFLLMSISYFLCLVVSYLFSFLSDLTSCVSWAFIYFTLLFSSYVYLILSSFFWPSRLFSIFFF